MELIKPHSILMGLTCESHEPETFKLTKNKYSIRIDSSEFKTRGTIQKDKDL